MNRHLTLPILPLLASLFFWAGLPVGSGQILAQSPEDKSDPPAVGPEGMPDPVTRIKEIGENEFALDDIRFNGATREIRFPAKVNMVKDQIEYIIVTETGKTHESLLSTKTSPLILNTVMLLCRYKPSAEGLITFVDREGPDGGGAAPESEEKPEGKNPFSGEKAPDAPAAPSPEKKHPADNLLEIFVSYDKDGEKIEVLLDEWIYNTETKANLKDKYWVFTGSDFSQGKFVAELEGSIVAIYVDRFAMFNNPIKGNDSDEIWEPFTAKMPPVDTPLEVIIRPFKEDAAG